MKTNRAVCRGIAAAIALVSAASTVQATSLAPMFRGQYDQGQGIDAEFIKARDAWRQSGLLYDPVSDQLGKGQPIGSFPGGTGIWGLVDSATAHQSPFADMVEARWNGRVSEIAFGDGEFDRRYRESWAAVSLVPLFGQGSIAST